jgi:hypothetical protein
MAESGFDISAMIAGIVAYGVSVGAAVVLVFLIYRINTKLTTIDEQKMMLGGHRSVAICLGTVVLCQAFLLRHAVFPIMAVVRDLMLAPVSLKAALWVCAQCAMFFVVIAGLAFISVALGAWFFARMTGDLPEHEENREGQPRGGHLLRLRAAGHHGHRERGHRGPVALAHPVRAHGRHPRPMRPAASAALSCLGIVAMGLAAVAALAIVGPLLLGDRHSEDVRPSEEPEPSARPSTRPTAIPTLAPIPTSTSPMWSRATASAAHSRATPGA